MAHSKHGMTFARRTQVLLRAVLDIQQPLSETVMEEEKCAIPTYRQHPPQQVQAFLEVFTVHCGICCPHTLVKFILT
jgi:hypothetical protein